MLMGSITVLFPEYFSDPLLITEADTPLGRSNRNVFAAFSEPSRPILLGTDIDPDLTLGSCADNAMEGIKAVEIKSVPIIP
ncbi:hypothetical protein D3C81_2011930 [compost metagenome]